MFTFALQHGKKVGHVAGHGPPPPNTIGEVFAADLSEPINPVTVDTTTAFTADSTTWPTADVTHLPASDTVEAKVAVLATAIEAAAATDALDADVLAAGVSVVVEAADAADVLDAKVKAASGGGSYFDVGRVMPVVGRGYGVLPALEGEAHGVVGAAGEAVATLPISGAAVGEVGDDDLVLLMLLLAA